MCFLDFYYCVRNQRDLDAPLDGSAVGRVAEELRVQVRYSSFLLSSTHKSPSCTSACTYLGPFGRLCCGKSGGGATCAGV